MVWSDFFGAIFTNKSRDFFLYSLFLTCGRVLEFEEEKNPPSDHIGLKKIVKSFRGMLCNNIEALIRESIFSAKQKKNPISLESAIIYADLDVRAKSGKVKKWSRSQIL